LLVIGLTLLAPVHVQAAPIDDAKKAFAEGKAAFERGDYETALQAYQKANTILPAPNLYYNIGATYERLGRYQEAALAFDEYFKLAGAPQNDEDREFQDKLHARADADRKRPNVVPQPRVESQPLPSVGGQPQAAQPQAQPAPPPQYYAPGPYYMSPYGAYPMQVSREDRLRQAKARRTRAIVLMAIGVPMTVVGITLCAYSPAFNDTVSLALDLWAGITLGVVGITLWAPGAGSYVKSSREIRELSTPQPLPPSFSGAH
jgi:tetratricopeptide (TPR) repeat protein